MSKAVELWLKTSADTAKGDWIANMPGNWKPVLKYKQKDTEVYLCMSMEERLAMRTCGLEK